jgi:hypothetical protein
MINEFSFVKIIFEMGRKKDEVRKKKGFVKAEKEKLSLNRN